MNNLTKTIRVLDLFAGTQSVRKALELTGQKFDYIGIDIYSPEEQNTILDLTQDDIVNKLIEVLPQGWTPDFIWASPICNKFSAVITANNGNYYFVKENDELRPRTSLDSKEGIQKQLVNKAGSLENIKDAELALKMFENTKAIINHFNVPFAIENPATALSKYILKEYVKNDTNYCMYGFGYKKPTAIYTHTPLKLLKCNHKRHTANVSGRKDTTDIKCGAGQYADRARVPELLIKDIFIQLFIDDIPVNTTFNDDFEL